MSGLELPVSVTMITYNHEKYIAESIQSVLDQTFTDFELIIVNDGSTDKTDEIIRTFKDPRISYICQENQGPSVASNNAILTAKGKYIALMSGDDVCNPQRLEKQYFYATTTKYSVLFSWVDFIDDSGRLMARNHSADNYFNLKNKSSPEILRHFFFKGNYFCAPTAFIRKDLLLEAGLFCATSIQLQDFDLWVKLLSGNEFYICTDNLLKYRKRKRGFNLSSKKNILRTNFETCQIYRHIFDSIGTTLFKEAFCHFLQRKDFETRLEYEIEKSFLYFNHDLPFIRTIGVERLFKLLQDREVLTIAVEKYNFGLPSLYEIMQDERQIDRNYFLSFRRVLYENCLKFISIIR